VLAVGTSDGRVLLLDSTGKIRLNVQPHAAHAEAAQRAGPRAAQRIGAACVALSPDGHLVATASWDGAWKLLDASTGVELVRPPQFESPFPGSLISTFLGHLLKVVACQRWPEGAPPSGTSLGPELSVLYFLCLYRGTSLTRKRTPLGPYRKLMPRVLGGS
jgi:WD40 repeat protein